MVTDKTIFNIYSPFFPGFYGGVFDASDKAYYDIESDVDYYKSEYGIELDSDEDIEFDYKDYENDVAHVWCECLRDCLPDCVESMTFDGIWSPREYNFKNDELELTIVLKADWQKTFADFMQNNYEWLKERIHKDWSSRDGFMSFMENDIDEWPRCLFEDGDDRYIECIITYMMYRENKNIADALVNDVLQSGDGDIYTRLTDSGKEKVAEAEEKMRIKALNEKYQLKIPFVD